MDHTIGTTPDGLPLLSAGRHRRPRQGACLMELVSVLAGERWTDAPRCTHPLLARLARLVNDAVSDATRPVLARSAPSLVGLRGDASWDARIALLAATSALPLAAPWHQRPLAAAALQADALVGRAPGVLDPATRTALATAPDAARWAARYTGGLTRRPAVDGSAVVEFAVTAIARSGAPDVDTRLIGLLIDAVALCEELRAEGLRAGEPLQVAAPTGVRRRHRIGAAA